jgi:Zn-dependent peptidase ImmA (M78 family)
MKSPKVMFLQPNEIDSAAAELLRNFAKAKGKTISPPIPVEDIIEKYLKLRLEVKDLIKMFGTKDVLGATWFDEGLIRVDERILEQEGRYCFTLAHEVGHWILHRPQIEAEKVAPSLFRNVEGPPAFVCRSSDKPPAEWQADQFAARLMMPERFVREAFKDAVGEQPVLIDGLRGRRADPAVVAAWRGVASAVQSKGNFSNVSNEAMRYRLSDLNLVREVDRVQHSLL